MKKTLILTVAALLIGCTTSPKKNPEPDPAEVTLKFDRIKYHQQLSELIRLFDNYYHSTEDLLDSADLDHSFFSTPTGIKYLQDRDALNELFNELEYNSNHKHITK